MSASDGAHSTGERRPKVVGSLTITKQGEQSLSVGTCDFGSNIDVEGTGGVNAGYASLQDAFTAINGGVHTGAIKVEICTSETEPAGSAVLNSSGAGSASYTSVNIYPIADGVTVVGAAAMGRGLVELNGADNVTIDGDNPNTSGTNRNLTFQNTAISTLIYGQVLRIALSGSVTSADNDTFKNMNLIGHATGRNISTATSAGGSENTSYGIIVSSNAGGPIAPPAAIGSLTTTVGSPLTAANLVIQNNRITTVARGIALQGSATTVFPGLTVENNVIGNPIAGAADQVYSFGITAQGSTDAVIRGNIVYVESFLVATLRGIDTGSISGSGSGFTIERNQVLRVQNSHPTSAQGAYGINLQSGGNHIVRNNFVSGVINGANTTFNSTVGAFGIRIASGNGHMIYHNSVNLNGLQTGSSQSMTAGFCITSTAFTGIDVRNNIFRNVITGGSSTSAHAAIYLPSSGASAMNLTISNNDYVQDNSTSAGGVAQVGMTFISPPSGPGSYGGLYQAASFNSADTSDTANLRTYTSVLNAAGTNDNASVISNPLFISNTDLHVSGSSPVINAAANVGVTSDIDGQARPYGAAPDIGADEIVPSAAGVSLAGRVVTTEGQGIRNVIVTIEGGSLTQPIFSLTGPFGYYRFDELPAGQTYVISVRAKRFTFAIPTRAVNLDDELLNVDFVSEP
ncbi:MAG: choice-of-anchor Q domain-containing protein [Pyrinomonadaceae bacterium]